MKLDHQYRQLFLFLIALLIFISVVGIAWLFQDQIKEAVIVPLLYLMWVGDLLIRSFDQQCIWIMALIITLFLSLSFYRRPEEPLDTPLIRMSHRSPRGGRIQFWRSRVRVDPRSIFVRNFHWTEMRRMIYQAIAYHEGSDIDRVKKLIQDEQLGLPEAFHSVLGLGDQQFELIYSRARFSRIRQILDWIKERFVEQPNSTDPRLEEIADYLEKILEVDNDFRSY